MVVQTVVLKDLLFSKILLDTFYEPRIEGIVDIAGR